MQCLYASPAIINMYIYLRYVLGIFRLCYVLYLRLMHWSFYSGKPCFSICKVRGSLMCLPYFIVILVMGICKTRHWQTSGRMVQEFNVCTVVGVVGDGPIVIWKNTVEQQGQ